MDFSPKPTIAENHYAPADGGYRPPQPGATLSISSEQINGQKSMFQRYIFDFSLYSHYFNTKTSTMRAKLLDAAWPLIPENQSHLKDCKLQDRQSFELYGPVWIFVTMIVEFLVLGHLCKLFDQVSSEELQEVATKYGIKGLDPSSASANQSLHKIITMTFLLALFTLGVPFGLYRSLRSQN